MDPWIEEWRRYHESGEAQAWVDHLEKKYPKSRFQRFKAWALSIWRRK